MPPRSPPHSDFDDNDSIIFTPISMVADEPHCPPAAPVTPRHTFQPHVTRVTWPRIVFCRAGSFYWLHFWNEAKGHEKGSFYIKVTFYHSLTKRHLTDVFKGSCYYYHLKNRHLNRPFLCIGWETECCQPSLAGVTLMVIVLAGLLDPILLQSSRCSGRSSGRLGAMTKGRGASWPG